jgi:hypothetical protein
VTATRGLVSLRLRLTVGALVALSWLGAAGCQKDVVDAGPEAIVEEFIIRMQRVHGDPKAGREAYDLMWSEAQRALVERAKRASAVAGREVAPASMIAPTRFSLTFTPKRYSTRIDGDWAVVSVIGEAPSQRHDVKCVREDGHWRVALMIPPLSPIQKRDDPRQPMERGKAP